MSLDQFPVHGPLLWSLPCPVLAFNAIGELVIENQAAVQGCVPKDLFFQEIARDFAKQASKEGSKKDALR